MSGSNDVRRGRADADRHRRRVGQPVGRRGRAPGVRGGQRRRHRRGRRRDRQRVRPGGRDRRARPSTWSRTACSRTSPRRSSPTTTRTGTSRRCSPGRRPTRPAGSRSPTSPRAATRPRTVTGGRQPAVQPEQPARLVRRAERDREQRPSATPRSSSASRTCWAAPGRPPIDCSGLVMMAYRAAGVNIPRTSQQQWKHAAARPRVQGGPRRPGVLRRRRRHAQRARARRPGDRQEHDDRGVRHGHSRSGSPRSARRSRRAATATVVGFAQPWPGKAE